MNNAFWQRIKYFKPSEFNYPDKISEELIIAIDSLREFTDRPIVIHSDYRPGDNGQHGKGLAVDLHIKGMHVIDQFLVAERIGLFKGIGVYPNWNNPGLHLDIREGCSARWGCWQSPIYVPLDMPFFRRILENDDEKR